MHVTKTESQVKTRALLAVHKIKLVLLDIMMPGKDSLLLAGPFRTTTRILVICLTAETGTMNRIQGSDIVADNHGVKPFVLRELPTLFRAVLRGVVGNATTSVHAPDAGKFPFGKWV